MILLKLILQWAIIIEFFGLGFIGLIEKDYNLGFGMNIALAILYIFIYLQPIK